MKQEPTKVPIGNTLVLNSGGMDSVTLLEYIVSQRGAQQVASLFIDYGQAAKVAEGKASRAVADKLGVGYKFVSINLSELASSTIMETVEKKDKTTMDTYVPARNMILIGLACAWAINIGAQTVAIGVHFDDDPLAYPDCKPEFIIPMRKACLRYGISLYTPFLFIGKKEIVKMGMKLGVDYESTSSCYWPSEEGESCGECPSCVIRAKGFRQFKEAKED